MSPNFQLTLVKVPITWKKEEIATSTKHERAHEIESTTL